MIGRNSIKFFLFGGFVALFLMIAYFIARPDGLLHIVFCDVGQGDAIYLRFPNGDDGLIDGGGNQDVLTCLGTHMAFWDRKIEFIVLTHPQHDHYAGLTEVMSRYNVDTFLVSPVENEAKSYQTFKEIAKISAARIHNPYQGEQLRVGEDVLLDVWWPEAKWVQDQVSGQDEKLLIARSDNVLGLTTSHDDFNDFSLVFLLSYKDFNVLFTGDAEYDILEPLVVQKNLLRKKQLEVVKIGHHGGKNALSGKLMKALNPELSVISVGARNSYGHPAQITLDLLGDSSSKIARTDLESEIEVLSDGERWSYSSTKEDK